MHFAGLRRKATWSFRYIRLAAVFALMAGTALAGDKTPPPPSAEVRAKIAPTQKAMDNARDDLADLRDDLADAKLDLTKARQEVVDAEEKMAKMAEEELLRQQGMATEPAEPSFMDKVKTTFESLLPNSSPAEKKTSAEEKAEELQGEIAVLEKKVTRQVDFIGECESTLRKLESKADYLDAKAASDAATTQLQYHEAQVNKMKVELQQTRDKVNSLTSELGDMREGGATSAELAPKEAELRETEKSAVELYKQIDYHQYSAVTMVKQAEKLHEMTEKHWMEMREAGVTLNDEIQIPSMKPEKIVVEKPKPEKIVIKAVPAPKPVKVEKPKKPEVTIVPVEKPKKPAVTIVPVEKPKKPEVVEPPPPVKLDSKNTVIVPIQPEKTVEPPKAAAKEPEVKWKKEPEPVILPVKRVEPPAEGNMDVTPTDHDLDAMGAMQEDPAAIGGSEVHESDWASTLLWPFRKIGDGCVWLKDKTMGLFSSDGDDETPEVAPEPTE